MTWRTQENFLYSADGQQRGLIADNGNNKAAIVMSYLHGTDIDLRTKPRIGI